MKSFSLLTFLLSLSITTIGQMNMIQSKNGYEKISGYSLSSKIYYDKLNFTEISKNEFQSYKEKYKTSCVLDSGKFISGSNLYVIHDCKEICETYLAERNTNKKMLMPSNYDSGVLKMLLSPSCTQLLVCSSYDGPEYGDYYEHRAEIFLFNVLTGVGLKGITPSLNYYTNDWSINDLTWVDEHTIALELYHEPSMNYGENLKSKYFKSNLKVK